MTANPLSSKTSRGDYALIRYRLKSVRNLAQRRVHLCLQLEVVLVMQADFVPLKLL